MGTLNTDPGATLQSWSLTGKVDGLGADPRQDRLIVTVNEDGNSSLYTISPAVPAAEQVRHYTYLPAPDSGTSGGALTGEGQPAGVDDIRWTDGPNGTLLVIDNGTGTVYAVTGPFAAGEALASLDTVGATAQNTEVDTIDLSTGALTPFIAGLTKAKGLLWFRGRASEDGGD